MKLAIQNMLGAQIMTNCERYLGLPIVGGGGGIKGEHLQGDTRAGNKKGDGMEREAHLKGPKRGVDQNRSTSNSNLLHEHVQVP